MNGEPEHRTAHPIVIPRIEWEWFGYPGHFIGARECLFRLCTKVGDYLISTVGDYRPFEREPRKTIGAGERAFFETFVFKAGPRCSDAECGCRQPSIDGSEIDGECCATAGEAQALHLRYCQKYAQPGATRDE